MHFLCKRGIIRVAIYNRRIWYMLKRIEKKLDCTRCLRAHCVNKGVLSAKQDYSCYQPSGCASCNLYSVCASTTKDTEVFDLSARLTDSWPIPCCFVSPICDTCFKASHCRNKNMRHFELNLEDPTRPHCFSGYHSIK